MKLLFKQRLLSWLDSYDIFDENWEKVYSVEGKLALGHTLVVSDYMGRELATLKQRLMTLLPRFDIIMNDTTIGTITQEFSLFKPIFVIDYNGWRVDGNFWEFDYRIYNTAGEEIAIIEKQFFNFTDTYIIDVHNPDNALQVLMTVLAIDAAKCSQS